MIWNPGDGSALNEGGAGSDTVEVDGRRLRFEKALIATGSGPAVPNMPGLAAARYLTNETERKSGVSSSFYRKSGVSSAFLPEKTN